MVKNYQNNCHYIVNTTDLTFKQLFDIFTKLVSEQDEISGLETIGWENHSWRYLSPTGDERIINLQRTKVYVFSDSVLCLGKILENPQSNDAWEQRLGCLKSSSKYKNFDRIDGEPMEFEWSISQDSIRCSSMKKSTVYCSEYEKHQKISQEEFYLCRCSTTFPVDQKTTKQMPNSYLRTRENLEKDNGHSSVLVQRKSGTLCEDSPQGVWDKIEERMLLEFAESGCPIFRATSPLYRGQLRSKGHGKLLIHYAAVLETVETIYVSHNCLCKPAQSLRSSRRDM